MRVEDFISRPPLNEHIFVSEAIFPYAHNAQLLLFGRMHRQGYQILAAGQFSHTVRKGLSTLRFAGHPLAHFNEEFQDGLKETAGEDVNRNTFGGWVINNKENLAKPVMFKTLIHFQNALPSLNGNTIPGWNRADMDADLDLFKNDSSDETLVQLADEIRRRHFGLMLAKQLVAIVETYVEMALPYTDTEIPIEAYLKK